MTKKLVWLDGGGVRNYVLPYPTYASNAKQRGTPELRNCEQAKVMFAILTTKKKITPRKAKYAVCKH
jgi:hypothetical protein